jgi:hypothetical protein
MAARLEEATAELGESAEMIGESAEMIGDLIDVQSRHAIRCIVGVLAHPDESMATTLSTSDRRTFGS